MIRLNIHKCLGFVARLYLWRFKPTIIAITGNVGKTSTKEAIAVVLKKKEPLLRVSRGNLNTKPGVALTIVGDWGEEYYKEGGSGFFWLKALLRSIFRFF